MALANGQLTSKSGYLPNEVLSNIFQECLVLDERGCTFPCPHSAPLVLTWVCRLWRTVALNTHRLWDGITLLRDYEKIQDTVRLLKLWIERSGALPFAVRFYNVTEDGEDVFRFRGRADARPALADGLRALVDALLTCSKRWRVLEVVLPNISFATPLVDAATTKARGLEDFCVSLRDLGVGDAPYRYDFSQNTALREVRLSTPLIAPLPNANNQIFDNLTVLELHFCPSVDTCLTWLDMTPNLESLILRLLSTGQQRAIFHPGRQIRRLANLTDLEITCFATTSQADNPASILNFLELPALSDFELDLNHLFDNSPFQHVRDLLVRSGASLERLALSGTHMTDDEIVECLRLSPELEWLEIEIVSDVILRALTPRLDSDSEDGSAMDTTTNSSTPQTEGEQAEAANGPEPKDPSQYSVYCPKLCYFESSDVDACSLQVLYEMMVSRCEDVYKDILGYVDTTAIRPTPEAFKTLISVVLPCDPVYEVLSHPQVLASMERTVYF